MPISTFQELFLYLRNLTCLIDLVTFGLRPSKSRIRLPFDEMDKTYSMNLCNGVFNNFENMYENVDRSHPNDVNSTNAMFARFENTDNINYTLLKKCLNHVIFESDIVIELEIKKKLNNLLPQARPIIEYIEQTLASQFRVLTIFQWFFTDLEYRMNACMYKYEKYRTILDTLLKGLELEDPSRYTSLSSEFTRLLAQCKSYINEAMEDPSFSELRTMVHGPERRIDYSRLITLYHRCLLRIDVIPYRIQKLYQSMQKAFPGFDARFDYRDYNITNFPSTFYHF